MIKKHRNLRWMEALTMCFFAFLLLGIEALSTDPPYEFTPCSHSSGNVVCDKVPVKEVENFFNRTSFHYLKSAKVTFQPRENETLIPEDVVGTKRILDIRIGFSEYYQLQNVTFIEYYKMLKVDADAFRSTKSYTEIFTIENIDCTHLDLGFLSGFDRLTNLTFYSINNIHHCLPSLPPLPSLAKLHFVYCYEMNELKYFSALNNRLKDVSFVGGKINDETVDRIMDQLLRSSANTLEQLEISWMHGAVQVTRVPQNIGSFKALRKLDLSYNNISTVKSGELSFSVPVSVLCIQGNGIKEIEPGAFQGDFKDAAVLMYENSLTRFEESLFRPILQQMTSAGEGHITFEYKMDCFARNICHLAWLRQYQQGYILICNNGIDAITYFQELPSSRFNHCTA